MANNSKVEVRVISLSDSSVRRAAVEENLKQSSLRWEFFDALRGESTCIFESDPARQLSRFGRELSANEIGCFKSHIMVMSEFIGRSEAEWLLVLEDDVWFDPAFEVGPVINNLKEAGIKYVRLYAKQWKKADVVKHWNDRQLIRFRTDPYGSQAYIISRVGVHQLFASIKSIDLPIDDELSRFWQNGLDIFALFPFPAIERSVPSTIQYQRSHQQMTAKKLNIMRHIDRAKNFSLKTHANFVYRLKRRKNLFFEP